MALVVGVAVYAAITGQAGNGVGAPLPAEQLGMVQQAPIGRASGVEPQQAPLQQSAERNPLPSLPSITELKTVPTRDTTSALAPAVTTTPESRIESLNRALQTTPTPTPVSARSLCVPGDSAAYCVYTVREGDTLSSIAAEFGLKSEYLPGWELLVASNKPDIVSADDFIQPGQKLRIPSSSGVVHGLILDETIGDLADMFDVSSADITRANGIHDPDLVRIGQVLLIPNPKRIPSPEEAAPSAAASPTETEQAGEAPAAEPAPAATPTPEPAKGFIWPITASARITNYFSARHPLGIDLGLGHAPGSPVVAVAPGKVAFAGGDACCSYGYYVIIDHENGLKTLYAHLRGINVSVGQRVSQGQTLGPSGSTGYSTGVHLHFEVHKNGQRVDPMPYLP